MTGTREQTLKVALWLVPMVFAAGGFWALTHSNTEALSEDVAHARAAIEAHEDLRAHPVTEQRLETIVTEQRAVRSEQARQGENIAAICQATGASCR